jgi:hypothetical protein
MAEARPGNRRITVGADKAYDAAGFVAALRERNATPHVAQNTSNRRSAIDGRTTRHPGYAISGRQRKRIEEIFGWTKATAGFARPVIAGWLASVGSSPSPPPPTTWCVCPSYWARRHSHARIAPQYGTHRQNPVREPFQYRDLCNHRVCLRCPL